MPASIIDDKGGRRRWIPVLAAALCLTACSAAPEAGPATPALWVVKDDDTTIYLFGTVHQLPRGTQWDGAAVGRAIAAADELVLELTPAEMAAAPAAFARHATDSREGPVLHRIPTTLRYDARVAISDAPMSMPQLDSLDSWAAALVLAQAMTEAAGLDYDAGVEKALIERFRAAQLPIGGLETAEGQILLFERLPMPVQRAMLEKVIRDRDEAPEMLERLLSAWRTGDMDAMEQAIDDDALSIDGLSGPLLTERNADWATWIDRRMDRPGTVLVAVGAAHLAGSGSVQDALARAGKPVTRVQ